MHTTEGLALFITYHASRASSGLLSDHTLKDYRALHRALSELVPDTEVSELKPSDFRQILATAGQGWGSTRVRKLKVYIVSWLKWLDEEGVVESIPKTGKLQIPRRVRTAKPIYTPAELRSLWQAAQRPLLRALLGMGLFAGANCGDLQNLEKSHFCGQFFIRARVKTGNPRRAWIPSFVLANISTPLITKYGHLRASSVTGMWRAFTIKTLGENRPFTALRTTLRTIAGQVDGEAAEMAVMGLSSSAASAHLGRSVVGLEHYVNVSGISDDRIRAVGKAVMKYMQT